jgi:5-methylcytosine-specific restriction endonuclease McrA
MPSNPGAIHRQIAELLKQHPDGLTSGQIRAKLNIAPDAQAQLDRRRRDLRKWYILGKRQIGKDWVYTLKGERKASVLERSVNIRVRAAILGKAHGRCQMCGQKVEQHGVVLVIDHKIPVDWGGSNEEDNLWALCEECNAGKKAYFASQNQHLMRDVMRHKSIHVRIGEALKCNFGKPVPSPLIELVAGQEDWKKRTRELRYLGWEIDASRRRLASGKVESYYTLRKFTKWPDDPSGWIRDFERKRANDNSRPEKDISEP